MAHERDDWLTVSKLIELGLAYPGAKIRFDGEAEIVEVVLVDEKEFSLLDSDDRIHEWYEAAYPIVEPVPNVE